MSTPPTYQKTPEATVQLGPDFSQLIGNVQGDIWLMGLIVVGLICLLAWEGINIWQKFKKRKK